MTTALKPDLHAGLPVAEGKGTGAEIILSSGSGFRSMTVQHVKRKGADMRNWMKYMALCAACVMALQTAALAGETESSAQNTGTAEEVLEPEQYPESMQANMELMFSSLKLMYINPVIIIMAILS